MALEKLTIKSEKSLSGSFLNIIPVMFNPQSISMSAGGWQVDRKGNLVPSSPTPNILTLDLFFDTTLYANQWPTGGFSALLSFSSSSIPPENVQKFTSQITDLTNPSIGTDSKRPPLCKIYWGKFSDSGLVFSSCFLKSAEKTLTHFWEDGTPVRATLKCTFQEWTDPQTDKKVQNPIDDPVRIVKRGETLSSIAQEEYGDPNLWRIIANENRLLNPRKLKPGLVLTIPPLSPSDYVGGGV